MIEVKGKYTTANIMIDDVDEKTMGQIVQFINNKSFTNPVVIMPDCHKGKGACIGFTMEMDKSIIPNIVGKDIYCGMRFIYMKDSLFNYTTREDVERKIREIIPFGTDVFGAPRFSMKNDFPWKELNEEARKATLRFNDKFNEKCEPPLFDYEWFLKKCSDIGVDPRRAECSIGTLGSGNHFIEIGKGQKGNYGLTIHSGSRQFGAFIAAYHQCEARSYVENMKQNQYEARKNTIISNCPTNEIKTKLSQLKEELHYEKGLEYVINSKMHKYLMDMLFTQMYAFKNRSLMLTLILNYAIPDEISDELMARIRNKTHPYLDTPHNFIDFEDWIIRKGAIRSHRGEVMVIPFNMVEGTLVCSGKSNPEWNYSAPHGAGRVYSRTEAKKKINIDRYKQQISDAGIYSTSVCKNTLDEAPDAYKDPEVVKKALGPTAAIIDHIKPVIGMKDKKKKSRGRRKRGKKAQD